VAQLHVGVANPYIIAPKNAEEGAWPPSKKMLLQGGPSKNYI
jgi:hypothetical protein